MTFVISTTLFNRSDLKSEIISSDLLTNLWQSHKNFHYNILKID